jgi:hypothetical protein
VQQNLVRVCRAVALVSLAPIVTDGVGKDGARLVERRRRDAASDIRVALQTVLGVLVPEVERAVAARRAKCSMLGVERDVIDRVDTCSVALRGISVALEREV